MKKLLLIFVSIFLLGSNIYAGGPDWAKFPGAKAILDNMGYSAINGISPEAAIKNNPNIYTVEHTSELLKLLDEPTITLAEAKDYLSKAKAIFPIILNVNKLEDIDVVWSVKELLNAAEEKLLKLPAKRFLERIGKKYIDCILKDSNMFLNEMDGVLKKTWDQYLGKNLLIAINNADIPLILGTPEYEYMDGYLYQATHVPRMGQNHQLGAKLFQLKILCTGSEQDLANMLGTIELTAGGKTLGETLTVGLSTNDFSLDGPNSYSLKEIKTENLSKGLENLTRITNIIEKK
jgi:hypothetical protein